MTQTTSERTGDRAASSSRGTKTRHGSSRRPEGAGQVVLPAHGSAPPVPASSARVRRRPALVGAGIALVALGGLASAWLITTTGDTVAVLAVTRPVAAGQALQRSDLTAAQAHQDPAVQTVRAADIDAVIGRRAAAVLTAGSLLTPASTTAAVVPGRGSSLVGVALSQAQMPAEELLAGDRVRIVDTPSAQANPPLVAPDVTVGRVVAVAAPGQTGTVTVDVLVPEADAASLAARAATGRVALILDSRER